MIIASLAEVVEMMILICCLIVLLLLYRQVASRKIQRFSMRPRSRKHAGGFPQGGFPQAKPMWVKSAILEMHENLHLSHRKLADLFNNLYFAKTGMSVGRTWVRETIMRHEREKLHRNKAIKHRLPPKLAQCDLGHGYDHGR